MSPYSQIDYSMLAIMDNYFSPHQVGQLQRTQFRTLHDSLATVPASGYFYARSVSDGSGSASSDVTTPDLQGDRRKDRKDKRRAQNRIAQRAYRERKEQIRQELEVKVKLWQAKHDALRESYQEQTQEVNRLKEHIENLQKQLLVLRDHQTPDELLPNDFDMWPYLQWEDIESIRDLSNS